MRVDSAAIPALTSCSAPRIGAARESSRTLAGMVWIARPARDEGGLVHQIVVIVAMSLLSGVLIAGLALPWVALVSKGAENSAEAIQDFPKELRFQPLNERTRVLAADGSRLAVFYDENRTYVSLEDISPRLKQAIVAIEDSRFYAHGALDIEGTLRALLVNQANSATLQGGSSITQQLVKLTLLESASTAKERAAAQAPSYSRKFDELRYAVWVEQRLSKDEILEQYLNTAYFGDGAYGIQSAANHYFSTTAKELTLAQSAMLAGLVKNPSRYDPTNSPGEARDRRDTVIATMRQLNIIADSQAKTASKGPVRLKETKVANGCVDSDAPFFCEYLLKYLLDSPDLGDTAEERRRAVYGGGLTIRTTFDPRFQRAADRSVGAHVYPRDGVVGALAMVEPGTGYVRALAQSKTMGPRRSQGETFVNYTVPTEYGGAAGFQPGSTFKAFVLAAAIKQGTPLNKTFATPDTITVDPSDYTVCDGSSYPSTIPYQVSNSTSRAATADLYTGTQNSVNTFYIQLEELTGLCEPWKLANAMGVDVPKQFIVPSFTLGVADASPLEMAEAYATFAARGMHCASTPITEITDRNGEVLPIAGPQCSRVLRRPYADAVNDILRGVMLPPDGFGAGIAPVQDSAGKTGTTNKNKAVWFVGYTPNLAAAAVIAGINRQGEPAKLVGKSLAGVVLKDASGAGTAGPLWGDALEVIERWLPDRSFIPPSTDVPGQEVPIPSFYGIDPNVAAAELTELGLRPQISYSVNSSAPEGTVAYTAPSFVGETGEPVLLVISNGYPPPSSPTSTTPAFPTSSTPVFPTSSTPAFPTFTPPAFPTFTPPAFPTSTPSPLPTSTPSPLPTSTPPTASTP